MSIARERLTAIRMERPGGCLGQGNWLIANDTVGLLSGVVMRKRGIDGHTFSGKIFIVK
jgi:hypothetical protein